MKIKIKRKKLSDYSLGFSFLLPAFIMICTFSLYPIIKSLRLSFYKWDGVGEMIFKGLANYQNVFSDSHFYVVMRNSIIYMTMCTALVVGVGFMLALIIDLRVRGWKVYRIIFFVPYVTSIFIYVTVFKKMFEPYGLINTILSALSLDFLKINWFIDPYRSILLMSIMMCWAFSAFTMMFFIAGMGDIDEDIYEAAKIDGASTFQRIIKITIPLLKNVFSMMAVFFLIMTFKGFGIVYILTRGGPYRTTEILGVKIYMDAFYFSNFGDASVYAVLSVFAAVLFAIMYRKVSGYDKKKL